MLPFYFYFRELKLSPLFFFSSSQGCIASIFLHIRISGPIGTFQRARVRRPFGLFCSKVPSFVLIKMLGHTEKNNNCQQMFAKCWCRFAISVDKMLPEFEEMIRMSRILLFSLILNYFQNIEESWRIQCYPESRDALRLDALRRLEDRVM